MRQRHETSMWLIRISLSLALVAAAIGRLDAAELSRPNPEGTPTKVDIALYLVDLQQISASDETFLADIILLADWTDPRLVNPNGASSTRSLDEVWNPRLDLPNRRDVTAALPMRVEVDAAGHVRYRQRWIGHFSAHMNFSNFPLDRQPLSVQVVSLGYSRQEVNLAVREDAPMPTRAEKLSLDGWDVGRAWMENADYGFVRDMKTLSGVQLRLDATRHSGYYVLQLIFPLALIVLMGTMAMWLDPAQITPRVSIAVTSMLTLIVYRFTLGRSVPELTYLTRFDYIVIASTLLVFLNLLAITADVFLVNRSEAAFVRRLDRIALLGFPIALVVMFMLAWWA